MGGMIAMQGAIAFSSPAISHTLLSQNLQMPDSASVRSSCPTDVEALITLLLPDLPSYANREIQRARRLSRSVDLFSYVLIAGKPEFEPLSLGPGDYTAVIPSSEVEPPQQVFITTLERKYSNGREFRFQQYHWLFLTQTPEGWRLALMYSRLGSTVPGRPPTPPRETSNSAFGQAIKLWLRDCRAGSLRTPRLAPIRGEFLSR